MVTPIVFALKLAKIHEFGNNDNFSIKNNTSSIMDMATDVVGSPEELIIYCEESILTQ